MCEPTTIGYIAIGLTLAAGGATAYSQRQTGKFNEQVANVNAENEANQAKHAAAIGLIEEERHRVKVRQFIGAQRVRAAANNVDISSGSALTMQAETARFGAEDATTIRANALQQAWGFNTQAANSRSQGRLARYAGDSGAIGTLLTTGAQAGGIYANMPR